MSTIRSSSPHGSRARLVFALVGSAAVFAAVAYLAVSRFRSLYGEPGVFTTYRQAVLSSLLGSMIAWAMVVVPGVVLAVRGRGWLSLAPVTITALFGAGQLLVPFQDFARALGDRNIFGALVGWAVATAAILIVARPRRPTWHLDGPSTGLGAALAVWLVALFLVDRAADIIGAPGAGSGRAWAVGLAAAAFAVGSDPRTVRDVAKTGLLLILMQGALLAVALYIAVYGGPVDGALGLSTWELAICAISLAIMPLSRQLDRLHVPAHAVA